MPRNLFVLVVAFSLSLVFTDALAQPAAKIAPGQRVRVTTDSDTAVGTVVAVTPDSVRLTDGAVERTVSLTNARRIEVSLGGKSKGAGAKKGAIRGALILGAAGAILAGLQHEEIGEDPEGVSVGHAAALGAWSGGLFGGLIGAGVGAARAGEKWELVFP